MPKNTARPPAEPAGGGGNPSLAARQLWPVLEAAWLLGVSRATIWRRIEAGDLRTIRIGRRAYITDAELRRYIANLEAAS